MDLFPDDQELKSKFYALSKRYHPDINQATNPASYVELLERSGQINTAYKTLTDLNLRLRHILELSDVRLDANEQLPPAFLMEMMELNETLLEASTDEYKKEAANKTLDENDEILTHQLRNIWSAVENKNELTEEILDTLKGLYFQQKYLLRIRRNLNHPTQLD